MNFNNSLKLLKYHTKYFIDEYLLIAILLLYAIIFSIFYHYFGYSYITLNDAMLFLTILVLICYTAETRGMRKEMIAQNDLEQKPIIDLYYRPATSGHVKYFRLRNNGKGIAYNINIDDIKIDNKVFKFYSDDPNSILIIGEEKTLNIIGAYQDNKGEYIPLDSINFFFESIGQGIPKNENGTRDLSKQLRTELVVSYENALKKKIKRIFIAKCVGIKFLEQNIENDIRIVFDKEEYDLN